MIFKHLFTQYQWRNLGPSEIMLAILKIAVSTSLKNTKTIVVHIKLNTDLS